MDEKDLISMLKTRKIRRAPRGWLCPDEAQLAAYVDGRSDVQTREHLEQHLADCDFCLGQVGFLARAEAAAVLENVPELLLARAKELAPSAGEAVLKPAWRWAAVAAATACLVLVVALRRPHVPAPSLPPRPPAPTVEAPSPPSGPALEAPGAPETVRRTPKGAVLLTLLFPSDGSILSSKDLEFRWKPVRHSLFYDVRVVTAEGDLLWEGRAEASQARLPDHVHLQPGRKYFVWVRAYLAEGKTLKSAVVGFSVRDH